MKFNLNEYRELVNFRTLSSMKLEQDMFIFYLESLLIKQGFWTEIDEYGNMYAERGKSKLKPLIIAHVDINQRSKETPELIRVKDWLIGISVKKGTQIGCGHDDKAGIYFALQVAKTEIDCKIIFTKDEEIGCLGAKAIPKSWLENISFAIQLDRRGSSDVSKFTNGVTTVSKSFIKKSKDTLKAYGMKYENCIYTDVGELKAFHEVDFCCINVSCGYYNEHTDSETLNISELENSMSFGLEMLILFGYDHQHHKAEARTYKYGYWPDHDSWYNKYKASKKLDSSWPVYEYDKNKMPECDYCGSISKTVTYDSYTASHICKYCNEQLNK